MSDTLRPSGLYSPWNYPGQNIGVGSLSLLQGTFPTHGLNPGLPHCKWILYQQSHLGSPRILEWVAYPFSSRSSWPRNWTGVSCIAGEFFSNWAIREAPPTCILIHWTNTLCDPMDYRLHGILQARILEVGSLSLLQGIFPTQGWDPGLPHCKWILYQLSHKGWLVPTLYVWGWGNSSWSQELLFFLSIHGFTYLFNSLLVCTYYVSITVLGTGVPMMTGK